MLLQCFVDTRQLGLWKFLPFGPGALDDGGSHHRREYLKHVAGILGEYLAAGDGSEENEGEEVPATHDRDHEEPLVSARVPGDCSRLRRRPVMPPDTIEWLQEYIAYSGVPSPPLIWVNSVDASPKRSVAQADRVLPQKFHTLNSSGMISVVLQSGLRQRYQRKK